MAAATCPASAYSLIFGSAILLCDLDPGHDGVHGCWTDDGRRASWGTSFPPAAAEAS